MDTWNTFFGPNAGYAQELYERYRQDPSSVDPATRAFFDTAPPPPPDDAQNPSPYPPPPRGEGEPEPDARSGSASPLLRTGEGWGEGSGEPITDREIRLVVGTAKLARMIRTYGHLA